MIGMVKWSDKTKRLESDVISWAMPKGKIFQHSKQNHMMSFDRFLARSIPLNFTVSVFDSFCWYCPFCDGISPTKKKTSWPLGGLEMNLWTFNLRVLPPSTWKTLIMRLLGVTRLPVTHSSIPMNSPIFCNTFISPWKCFWSPDLYKFFLNGFLLRNFVNAPNSQPSKEMSNQRHVQPQHATKYHTSTIDRLCDTVILRAWNSSPMCFSEPAISVVPLSGMIPQAVLLNRSQGLWFFLSWKVQNKVISKMNRLRFAISKHIKKHHYSLANSCFSACFQFIQRKP